MAASYAGSILGALRAKRAEDLQRQQVDEQQRINIPGMIAGMLSGAYIKGGGKGLDLKDVLTPEGFYGGAAGGVQSASTDQFRNALLGAIGGMGTAQGYQKNIREQGQEALKQTMSIGKYPLELAKMKTDILKYAEPLQVNLLPGEELPAGTFEMEGIIPGVKYFRYRKQPNYIMQFLQDKTGGE